MIPSLRQQTLLEILENDGKIHSITDLTVQLNASESTLRRDLKALEQLGKISVLRGGGACVKQNHTELDIESKLQVHLEEKRSIARYAVSLLQPGDVIFLDPSSICCLMIDDAMAQIPLTVVTNSGLNMTQLLKKNIRCIMIGGEARPGTTACVGSMAEEMMRRLSFTKCFLGASGLSETSGITNHDPGERFIKHLAIERSLETYFLINSSKAGITTLCQVADIESYPILMDRVPEDLKKYGNIIGTAEQE